MLLEIRFLTGDLVGLKVREGLGGTKTFSYFLTSPEIIHNQQGHCGFQELAN